MLEQIIGLHHQLGRNVTLQWISAHEGAYGNEAAGVAAREATRWRETQRSWTDSARPPRASDPHLGGETTRQLFDGSTIGTKRDMDVSCTKLPPIPATRT